MFLQFKIALPNVKNAERGRLQSEKIWMKMEIAISFAQDGTNVETQQIMKQDKTVDHVLPKRLFQQVTYFHQLIKYRNLVKMISI